MENNKINMKHKKIKALSIASMLLLSSACVSTGTSMVASPAVSQEKLLLVSPKPIDDNSGQFMAPYTSDAVVAEWVEKGRSASLGANAGGLVGSYAGSKLLENVPMFGSMLGQAAGESIGRKVAIDSAGGLEAIKASSDLSFNNLSDMSKWMYVHYRNNQHYADVLKFTMEIYPEMKEVYYRAIRSVQLNAKGA